MRLLAFLVLIVLAAALARAVPAAAPGALAPTGACFYEPNQPDPDTGQADPSPLDGVCAPAHGLNAPAAVVVSPDGRDVYVAGSGDDAISAFRRAADGSLRPSGCVSDDPADTGCAAAQELYSVGSLAMSPDGRSLYAVAASQALAIFRRDPSSGALTQLAGANGCADDPSSGDDCTPVSIDTPSSVAVSPDGKNVYAVSAQDGVVDAMRRDPSTGALSQIPNGCLAAPVGGDEEGTITTNCTVADGLAQGTSGNEQVPGLQAITVTPDGKNVIAVTEGAVDVFARAASGALTQSSCVATQDTVDASAASCKAVNGIGSTTAVAVTPDGSSVVVSSWPIVTSDGNADAGLALFHRDASGALSFAGCVTDLGADGCTGARGLHADSEDGTTNSMAMSPDGRDVYVATLLGSGDPGVLAAFAVGSSSLGCIGAAPGCTPSTKSLAGASAVAVSPDGRNVYATGYLDNSLTVFSRAVPAAKVTVVTHGKGTVTSLPAGLRCSATCARPFTAGTRITLRAKPAAHYRFAGWGGACSGRKPACTITPEGATRVTAQFAKK